MIRSRSLFCIAAVLCGLFVGPDGALAEANADPLVSKLEQAAACAARETSGAKQSNCRCSLSDAEYEALLTEISELEPQLFAAALRQGKQRNAVHSVGSDPDHIKLCIYFGLLDVDRSFQKERKNRFCKDALPSLKEASFQRANTAWCNTWAAVLQQDAAESNQPREYRAYAAALLLAHSKLTSELIPALREGQASGLPVIYRVPKEVGCKMLSGARLKAGLQQEAKPPAVDEFAKLVAEIEQDLAKLEINCIVADQVPHSKKKPEADAR